MRTFLDKKCQVRCENATRWGSSFLMLSSFIRAIDKNYFNDSHKCPYKRETLEIYFQILLPVYQFNLQSQIELKNVQKTESNICEVVPLLASLTESKLKRMELNGAAKALCILLIKAIEKSFHMSLILTYIV